MECVAISQGSFGLAQPAGAVLCVDNHDGI